MSVSLSVHVRPGARRTALGRRADGTLKLEVAAVPEGGRANEAVERLLAEVLGIGKKQVAVIRGRASRSKVIQIEGLTEEEVGRRIERALGEREASARGD